MARSILPLRRSILSKSQSFLQYLEIQYQTQNPISCLPHFLSKKPSIQPHTRSFGSLVSDEMTNSENNLAWHLRNQIPDESRLDKPPSDSKGFKVAERPGEQWITLTKKFGESEDIKIEVTMFDGSAEGDKPGEPVVEEEEKEHLHITMMISIFKDKSNRVLEFICSAWPDTLEIQKLFVRQRSIMLHKQPYTGPIFEDLDDELQDSLYNFLEKRGVDDNLCEFVHSYIHYKDKAEYIRWMESACQAIENK